MVLRNLLVVILIYFTLVVSSYCFPEQKAFIIKDTAEYIQKNSYFYNKDQYKDILTKSVNTINSSMDSVLVKIKWNDKAKFEIHSHDIEGNFVVLDLPFKANGIKDVGKALNNLIEFLERMSKAGEEAFNDNNNIRYMVANAMLQHVDEYSSMIHPDLFEDFKIESKGSFGGLGIVIGIRDEKLTIISPIEGTPADKIGVKANDKISRIEGFDTAGFTLEQAIKLLRGEKGTPITIFVERENVPDLIEFKIVRDIIKIKSIESKSLSNNVGYIKVKTFQSNTYEQFITSLNLLRDSGNSSLVLDLRGNPGGLFGQALKISNVFLKQSLIVSTKSKTKEMNLDFFTSPYETPKFEGPLIVLTDGGSASASEIVTGAIKNNARGIIIGQKTFGKGTVQEVYSQNDGSGIKLTTAEYLSPENYKVHLNGIKPDINFIPIKLKKNRLLTEKGIEKQLLDNNYSNTVYDKKPKFNIIYSPKELKEEEDDELISFSTYILDSDLINKIQLDGNIDSFLTVLEARLSKKVKVISKSFTDELKNFSLIKDDFLNTGNNLTKKVSINKQKRIGFVPGVDKEMNISIMNNSNKDFSNIIIKSESDNKTFDNKYFYVGNVKANKQTELNILFELPSWIKTSKDVINLSLLQLDMSQALRPTFLKISETKMDIKVTKNKFTFPEFSYSIRPIKKEGQISFDLTVEAMNAPIDCDKCYIHIMSDDKKLVIKNKKHKISEEQIANSSITSNLSIPTDNIKNNKIKFSIRFYDEDTRSLFDKHIALEKDEIISFNSQSKTYNTLINTSAYSEPSNDGIVLGNITSNSIFKTLGETKNFILASTSNKKIIFWIKKVDLEVTESTAKSQTFSLNRAYEKPPNISIKSKTKNSINKVSIEAVIADDSMVKNINYFLNDEKIRINTQNKKLINENFEIKLKPGRNKLYIVASDNKNIKTFKEIYLTKNEN